MNAQLFEKILNENDEINANIKYMLDSVQEVKNVDVDGVFEEELNGLESYLTNYANNIDNMSVFKSFITTIKAIGKFASIVKKMVKYYKKSKYDEDLSLDGSLTQYSEKKENFSRGSY